MTLMKVILFEGVREAGEWNVAAGSQTQWVPAASAGLLTFQPLLLGQPVCRGSLSAEGAAVLAPGAWVFAFGGMVLAWVLFCFVFFLFWHIFN